MTPRGILLLALGPLLTACGGASSTAEPEAEGSPADGTSLSIEIMGGEEPLALGRYLDWDETLRLRAGEPGVGGDEDGPWLAISLDVENSGARARRIPDVGLACDGSEGAGSLPAGDDPLPNTVPARGSVRLELRLLLPGDSRTDEPIPACAGPATIDVEEYLDDGAAATGTGWAVPDDLVDELNAARPDRTPAPTPTEPARDPKRPYAWVGGDGAFSSGYQVVVVPGITADQAIRVLRPVRGAPDPDDFERVVVADHGDGVVLFTWGLISDEDVTALSRVEGLAASVGNTGEADDLILIARRGTIVRHFDPFIGENYAGTPPLPQEKGLDLKHDTGPAAWTLLERLTKVHITEDWLLDDRHPGFRLRD